jgi:hypothetical protein
MGLTLRFGTSRWQFCVISIVITSYRFHFNLLELDIISKEEPISLLTILINKTYKRIEFFKLSKTIK